jgi:drug/metabolite transporter (DMT)-like permease
MEVVRDDDHHGGISMSTPTGEPRVVELANLLLLPPLELPPSAAAETEESSVVVALQARSETCQEFLLNRNENNEENNDETRVPQIQGVVDLDVLSAIAGLSRAEIDWPRTATASLDYSMDEGSDHHEGTPLLMPPSSAVSSITESYSMPPRTDTVILCADPFVDTLTEVLQEEEDDDDEEQSGITPGGAFFVPRPEHYPLNRHHYSYGNGGGTNGHSYPQQHAFLLEVPTQELPHFILALPAYDAWEDNVSEASEDDASYFLQGLSHLPTNVYDVQLEATPYTLDKDHEDAEDDTNLGLIRLDVVIQRKVPWIGYVLLILGLLSLSSVGTALNLQRDVSSPRMKSFWRYSATCVVLFPLFLHSIRRTGWPQLTLPQWRLFLLCSLCYAFMTAAFVVALELTTLADAFVLSNLAPLFIIVGRWVLGLPVLYMEGLGAGIGFVGGFVCASDSSPSTTVRHSSFAAEQDPVHAALLGNGLAVLASGAVAIYLLLAKHLRQHMDLFVFTFLLMLTSAVLVLIYMIFIAREPVSWSNDRQDGLFGWINWTPDRLPLELYMALICNVLGTTGYIAVMKYFEAVVVSTVMLMEPALGAILGALAGSDPLPGPITWLGNGIVTVGIALVVWSGAKTTETIDATKALTPANAVVAATKSPHAQRWKPVAGSMTRMRQESL